MSAIVALFVVLAAVSVAFSIFWLKHARAQWVGWPTPEQLVIGAVTDFFDTLGIGSFATTRRSTSSAASSTTRASRAR